MVKDDFITEWKKILFGWKCVMVVSGDSRIE
jgi:hypothetical protein